MRCRAVDGFVDVAGDRLLGEDPGELVDESACELVDVSSCDWIEYLRHHPPPSGIDRDQSLRPANDGRVIDLSQHGGLHTIATIAAPCPALLQGPLDPEDAERLAGALKAIADPSRPRLLSLIQAQPGREACVCHLTEPLGLGQPTVSHYLKVLLRAGLVEREQRGSCAYFRVCEEPLAALSELLT